MVLSTRGGGTDEKDLGGQQGGGLPVVGVGLGSARVAVPAMTAIVADTDRATRQFSWFVMRVGSPVGFSLSPTLAGG